MKVSYKWIKQFISIESDPEELSLILTGIGLEVESLEKVQSIPGGLEGLLIGRVLTCDQHPNADRLRVTTVDVGSGAPLQIVCGAPNVAAGQNVVVATVGTKVYPLEGEPFMINKSKIRGEVSEGMICAEDEIGLGKSHAGIMVLPDDVSVGQLAKEYFRMEDDFVFEIGLTPNRADAASHWGVARDLAAYFRTDVQLPQEIQEFNEGPGEALPVQIESKACLRYSSVKIEGILVGESTEWLKEKLRAIGLRSINNVVDVTNYVLHGLGQPLHAFDLDMIGGGKIIVRQATTNEVFVTLDDVERKLDEGDLVIADRSKPMCLAGVFGGLDSGVTEKTTSILLESAYFDPVSVRKTSKRHGLKTDSSFRFERGTDTDMTVPALKLAANLIIKVAGGKVTGPVSDIYPDAVTPFKFSVSLDRVRRLIGKEIPDQEILDIITHLKIEIESRNGDEIQVAVPPFKVDVTREVDVIEEVLRIYGYNNVEIGAQMKASLNASPKPDKEAVQNQVAELLVSTGFFEAMTNSLTRSDLATDNPEAVHILNPLSQDLGIMRPAMIFSLLEAIEYNQKRKSTDLKFFEFGKTYSVREGKYEERNHLVLAITGKQISGHWAKKNESTSFYHLKSLVDTVLKRLKLSDFDVEDSESRDLAYGLKYTRNGSALVSFGSVDGRVLKQQDIKGEVFFADFNWDGILKAVRKNKIVFQEVSKFPSVRRDLALLLDQNVSFHQLKKVAQRSERKLLKHVGVFDIYTGDKLPPGKKSYALSFVIQDEEKTLADKQIDAVINKLIINFEKELGAEIRKQ